MQFITFVVDNQYFAIELMGVERIVQAVALIALPHSPKNVAGAIDIHGEILPVIDLRCVLGKEPRQLRLTDQFVICSFDGHKAGLWVDAVDDVVEYKESALIATDSGTFTDARWVINDKEKVLLVCDWNKIFHTHLLPA